MQIYLLALFEDMQHIPRQFFPPFNLVFVLSKHYFMHPIIFVSWPLFMYNISPYVIITIGSLSPVIRLHLHE